MFRIGLKKAVSAKQLLTSVGNIIITNRNDPRLAPIPDSICDEFAVGMEDFTCIAVRMTGSDPSSDAGTYIIAAFIQYSIKQLDDTRNILNIENSCHIFNADVLPPQARAIHIGFQCVNQRFRRRSLASLLFYYVLAKELLKGTSIFFITSEDVSQLKGSPHLRTLGLELCVGTQSLTYSNDTITSIDKYLGKASASASKPPHRAVHDVNYELFSFTMGPTELVGRINALVDKVNQSLAGLKLEA
jgi:hypothetical protein